MEFITRLYNAAMMADKGARKLRELLATPAGILAREDILVRAVKMETRRDTLNEVAEALAENAHAMLQLSGGSLYKRKPPEQMN